MLQIGELGCEYPTRFAFALKLRLEVRHEIAADAHKTLGWHPLEARRSEHVK